VRAAFLCLFAFAAGAAPARDPATPDVRIDGTVEEIAPGIISSQYSDVRLTMSRDGRTALWFSRNRPGGPGGYDIWISRRGVGWSPPVPAPFDSTSRDFDPAFSRDGRFVYFASDRPGGAGGDDLYRVPVTSSGFGPVEHLGGDVNTPRNEWAPMLAPDGRTLLFSSDGHDGAGRMDLFTARRRGRAFGDVRPLPGRVNTPADEFDATFLADGRTIIFSRSPDVNVDDVRLFLSSLVHGEYRPGNELFDAINTPGSSTYAPMLDWSDTDHVTFTTRRPADNPRGADLYRATVRVR
jgi:Tol biopolymer transport system component